MTDKKTTFINKAKIIHGDKYDYSKTEYTNCKINVRIICNECKTEFEKTPDSHINSESGCPMCLGIIRTYDQFIEKAIKIHGYKYNYSKVEYIDSQTKVVIICQTHGEFKQTPNHHISRKDGCRKCGRENFGKTHRKEQSVFIEEAIKIHSNKYDYKDVKYEKNNTNIIIFCNQCNTNFYQTPATHLRGSGCYDCSMKNNGLNQRTSTELFIKQSIIIHGNKYDYSETIYETAKIHVKIICNIHGFFEQTPYHHLRGYGCHKCAIDINANRCRLSLEQFNEKAIIIHGDKYDYSKVEYINNSTNIKIRCIEHDIWFEQMPSNHLRGSSGCYKCSFKHYSKAQMTWILFIEKYYNIKIDHAENGGEYKITTRMKADGYCEDTNTIYEFHGDLWHGNPNIFDKEDIPYFGQKTFGELYQKTLEREQLIRDMGFNLVVMWESDWNKINNSIRTLQRLFRSSKRQ